MRTLVVVAPSVVVLAAVHRDVLGLRFRCDGRSFALGRRGGGAAFGIEATSRRPLPAAYGQRLRLRFSMFFELFSNFWLIFGKR